MKNMAAGMLVWLATAMTGWSREITVAYTGVTVNVLFACFMGTLCSFSFGEPVTPRPKMWRLGFTCLFMGAAFTGITNAVIKHTTDMQMTDGLQACVGAVVSCLTRFFLTWLIDAVTKGTWIDYVPFIKKRNGE